MFRRQQRGFSLLEILVTASIIAVVSVIAIVSYASFAERQRDDQRFLEMHRFAQKLEEFRNQTGAYVCGDGCVNVLPSAGYYDIDCSGTAETIFGNDPDEENGFLNGGDCCNLNPITVGEVNVNHSFGGFPAPTSTLDDSSWGLYKNRFVASPLFLDPIQGARNGLQYTYCYATPIQGRKSFALFTRLERSTAGATDGGITDEWYEILSDRYPRDGWWPGYVPPPPVCGNGIIEPGETCDDDNTVSGDGCSSSCQTETCGDGIVQSGAPRFEQCDNGAGNCLLSSCQCRPNCRWNLFYVFCGNGIIEPGEQCEASIPITIDCSSLDPTLTGTPGCVLCQYDTSSCFLAVP